MNRFEELIEFKSPNTIERKEILKKYAETSPIEFVNISWDLVSQKTSNWSGRELKDKIIKNSIHHAVLLDKDKITMEEIDLMLQRASILLDEPSYFS